MEHAVDPRIYSKEYFLQDEYGGGSGEEFSRGLIVQRFKDAFDLAGISPGMKMLDMSCGRGEMAAYCAKHGIDAVGVDYSSDAIALAEVSKSRLSPESQEKAKFFRIEGFTYPFEDNSFDRITLLDVAEHLSPLELKACFREAKRLLKEDGIFFVDTSPNRLFNDIAYPLWERPLNAAINMICKTKLMTRSARTELDRKIHINEHTLFCLKKHLKDAGFKNISVFMHPRKVKPRKMPSRGKQMLENVRCVVTCLFPLSCTLPLNLLFCNDIIAKARK